MRRSGVLRTPSRAFQESAGAEPDTLAELGLTHRVLVPRRRVAQTAERLSDTEEVAGSTPAPPMADGYTAPLNDLVCIAEGRISAAGMEIHLYAGIHELPA